MGRTKRRKTKKGNSSGQGGRLHWYVNQFLSRGQWRKAIRRAQMESPPFVQTLLRRLPHKIAAAASAEILDHPLRNTIADLSILPTRPSHDDLATELQWLVFGLEMHADRVLSFCSQRQLFDRFVLWGGVAEAREVLSQIREDHGESLWAAKAQILLGSMAEGLVGNRQAVTALQSEARGLASVILGFQGRKSEPKFSARTYEASVLDQFGPYLSDPEYRDLMDSLLFHILPTYIRPSSNFSYLTHHASGTSLVDRYIALLQLSRFLLALPDATAHSAIRSALQSTDRLRAAPELGVIAMLSGAPVHGSVPDWTNALLDAIDSYTQGDYQAAVDISATILTEHPPALEALEVYTRASVRGGWLREPLFPSGSLGDQLLLYFRHSVARTESSKTSLDSLYHLAMHLDATSMGLPMMTYTASFASRGEGMDWARLFAVSSSAPSPRQSQYIPSGVGTKRFLDSLTSRFGTRLTTEFFTQLTDDTDRTRTLGTIPPVRAKKHAAIRAFSQGDFRAANDHLDEVRTHPDAIPADHALTVELSCRSLMRRGEYGAAVRVVVDTYLENPALVAPGLFEDLFAHRREWLESPPSLLWPVFLHQYFVATDRPPDHHSIFGASDDFLVECGHDVPSQLSKDDPTATISRLVYYLAEVCTLEVLEYSFHFRSVDELEGERIRILRRLLECDPQNGKSYQEAIERLTRSAAIRLSVTQLDRSRVHVDTEGIRGSLLGSLDDLFDQCRQIADLPARLRKVVVVKELSSDSTTEAKTEIMALDQFLFLDLFEAIKQRFISSNEFGLDSYLSTRIRHGTLLGELRAPFEENHLVTKRTTDAGDYETNDYWLSELHDEPNSRLDERLKAMSLAVDKLGEEVKNQWIQVRVHERDPERGFDFRYDRGAYRQLHQALKRHETLPEFIDAAFDVLWERTRRCASRLERRIQTELRGRYEDLLSELEQDVTQIVNPGPRATLVAAIRRCKTEVQQACTRVAGWFAIGDEVSPTDFDFEHLIGICERMIERSRPGQSMMIRRQVPDALRCHGRHLKGFVDAMYILLDNIAQHSGVESPEADIAVAGDGDRVQISVANRVERDGGAGELHEVVGRLNRRDQSASDSAIIRREGGSGIAKLYKILEVDLSRGNEFAVEFTFDGTTFSVVVEMSAAELVR